MSFACRELIFMPTTDPPAIGVSVSKFSASQVLHAPQSFVSDICKITLAYALAFLSAHRAFIIADNFFFMAGLIGLRPARFLGAVLAFFGADLPFHLAQRCFIAAEIRLRAAALMRRRFLPGAGAACFALGGRPRRAGEESSFSAETALSIRLRSVLSSESKLCMSTNVLSNNVVATDCNRLRY